MSRAGLCAVLLSAAVLSPVVLSGAAAAAATEGPVAVLPFQNAGGGAKLDWLRVGMAETMLADLKRAGGVTIVERAQLDHALAELARQHSGAVDEATAVRAGKLVGAKTVVVGSFQQASGQLRLAARFVSVESGVVLDAATATGPVERVFALQDEVVDKLLGAPPAHRPRRKATVKTLQAYEQYAASLQIPDNAQKVTVLQAALALDPDLVYASDDLSALQKRMAGYGEIANVKLAEREKLLLERAGDRKAAPDERRRCARELLESLWAARRFRTIVLFSPKIAALKLGAEVDELASFRRFGAYDRLRQIDLALQAGESHLKTFPIGIHYRDVEARMHEVVEARRTMQSRVAEYQADLAEKRADLNKNGAITNRLEFDYAPCICARWDGQTNGTMLDACTHFIQQHGQDHDANAHDHLIAARYFIVLALAEQGDFARAKPLAEQLLANTHEWDKELRAMMDAWPTD